MSMEVIFCGCGQQWKSHIGHIFNPNDSLSHSTPDLTAILSSVHYPHRFAGKDIT